MEHDPFKLPTNERGEVLPQELNEQFLQALDQALARQETRQIQRIGGEQEARGFLQSGQTLKRVAEEVIGPGLERRQQALLPLAQQSAMLGREERLGTQQFERGRQLAGEDFQRTRQLKAEDFGRRLQEIDRMSQIQRDLLELQDNLEGGFFKQFGREFSHSFGKNLGKSTSQGLFSAGAEFFT